MRDAGNRGHFEAFWYILDDVSKPDHLGKPLLQFFLCFCVERFESWFGAGRAMWTPLNGSDDMFSGPWGTTVNWATLRGVGVQQLGSWMGQCKRGGPHEAKLLT